MPSAIVNHGFFQLAGLLICLAITGQLLVLLATSLRRAAFDSHRQSLSLDLLRARLEIEKKFLAKREAEVAAWNGYRKFTIERKVMEAENICSFYLKPHDRKPIPGFQPGQYLTFRLDIPGQKKEVIRCYSLSDRPRPNGYRVTIKKLVPPADQPGHAGGLVSSYFHDHLKEGDILDVKAPGGHFVLDTLRETPVVLIGGGIGVTPVLSMLQEIVESGSTRETWFFYGVTNAREHCLPEALLNLARANPHIRLRIYYSRPGAGHQDGRDFIYQGRVTTEVMKQTLPSNNYSFYICGPGPMMNDLTRGLKEWGVPAEQVHFEAFGPASVKQTPTPAPVTQSAPTLSVMFAKSGKTVKWQEGAGSLLEVAEAHGVSINFGCRAGNCGTCLTAIKSGDVCYLQAAGSEPEPGSCLACVCVPKTDLTLDA